MAEDKTFDSNLPLLLAPTSQHNIRRLHRSEVPSRLLANASVGADDHNNFAAQVDFGDWCDRGGLLLEEVFASEFHAACDSIFWVQGNGMRRGPGIERPVL
jgi:hypothetical protein